MLTDRIELFAEQHKEETLQLLKMLTEIPAPTGEENQRAQACREWLCAQGLKNVTMDEAGNVICPWEDRGDNELLVISAHLDTVFPDRTPIYVREEDGRLFAPGIGDDTANLVNMLMTIKFLAENNPALEKSFSHTGILFVADVGEEGLGNLKGSRAVLQTYGSRIRQWISFDLYYDGLYNRAVGSRRYRVKICTEGGHSYGDFGRPSAIAQMASVICELYSQEIPSGGKTTFNVGKISGGTTVNAIAESAEMLYEVRSDSNGCLQKMDELFCSVIEKYRGQGWNIQVEILGIRPGNGDVERAKQERLTACCLAAVKLYHKGEVSVGAASTDCNTALSMGIPAVTMGTVMGGQLHTRDEWIVKASMETGQKIAISAVLRAMGIE